MQDLAGTAGDRPHVTGAFLVGVQVSCEFNVLVYGNCVGHLDEAHPILPDLGLRARKPGTGDADRVLIRPESPPGLAEVIPGAGECRLRLHLDRLFVPRVKRDLPLVLGFREQFCVCRKRHPPVFDLLHLGSRRNACPDLLSHKGFRR